MVSLSKDPVFKQGWIVKPSFEIGLHSKDLALLKCIQNDFKVGNITFVNKNIARFRVYSQKDLNTIIDHFDKYPLLTQKQIDFELFKKICFLVRENQHITLQGFKEIVAIKSSLNKGLSEELKQVFPDIIALPRPILQPAKGFNPHWISGFALFFFDVISKKLLEKKIRWWRVFS